MIITPYDTQACSGYTQSLNRLSDELKKAHLHATGFKEIFRDTSGSGSSNELTAITVLPDVSGTVKPFGHPITIDGLRGEGKFIYADARTMYSIDQRTMEMKPKVVMNTALTWLEVRLKLQCLWQTPNHVILQSSLDYPTMLYGKILSEALARKYGLKPEVIARVDMLCAYAFWCFSHSVQDFERVDMVSLGNLLAQSIRSSGYGIAETIKDLEYFHTIKDLVEALKQEEVVGTMTMASITVATLFEISSSFWHITAGAPAQEIIACALEHPPTWMACIFVSLTNTSLRNNIDSVAQRYKRMSNPDVFINSIIHLIGDRQ